MRYGKLAACAALVAAAVSPAQAKEAYVYGPRPEWPRYKALAEAALRAKLPEPDRWRVEWPHGYVPGMWRHKGSFRGYMSCGMLRASEPIDGRAQIQFAIVIDYDSVRIADISSKEGNSLVNVWCGQLISKGFLPPASQMEPTELTIAALGLTIRPMPEGAYVVSARDGGTAGQAGIAAGLVLTRANGIALAGMGAAMGKLLESDVAAWSFETATGQRIEIKRR